MCGLDRSQLSFPKQITILIGRAPEERGNGRGERIGSTPLMQFELLRHIYGSRSNQQRTFGLNRVRVLRKQISVLAPRLDDSRLTESKFREAPPVRLPPTDPQTKDYGVRESC